MNPFVVLGGSVNIFTLTVGCKEIPVSNTVDPGQTLRCVLRPLNLVYKRVKVDIF